MADTDDWDNVKLDYGRLDYRRSLQSGVRISPRREYRIMASGRDRGFLLVIEPMLLYLLFLLTLENHPRKRRERLLWMKKSLRHLWTRSRPKQRLRSCSGSSPFSCSLCVGRSAGTWTLILDSSSVISSKSWRLALTNSTKGLSENYSVINLINNQWRDWLYVLWKLGKC